MSWRFGSFGGATAVESHTQQREPRPVVAVPEVGLRWGKAAVYEFDLGDEEEEARANGGVTLRWPAEYRTTERVIRFSPVWRRYEVLRVRDAENAAEYVDVAVTREVLLPISSETLLFVGGGIGYVENPGRYGYTERVVHTYVLLTIPSPAFVNAEVIGEGTVGEWPDYPEDEFSAGTVAAQIGGSPYGGSGGFDR